MKYVPGWIKLSHYLPNSVEHGTDSDIEAGLASWSRGYQRLYGVIISDGNIRVSLEARVHSNKWWQCDKCTSSFAGYNRPGKTRVQQRIIQKQIELEDVGPVYKLVAKNDDGTWCPDSTHIYLGMQTIQDGMCFMQLAPEHIGKWLTVTLNMTDQTIRIEILDRRF